MMKLHLSNFLFLLNPKIFNSQLTQIGEEEVHKNFDKQNFLLFLNFYLGARFSFKADIRLGGDKSCNCSWGTAFSWDASV
ncbi:hypothetical protein CDL12_23554 [Handroanthus impetiginosus]|uniref:Uncharacterized protein n=1 Tax=Handroanthus impetiginosus TaxID=429701 RepID=A0A2G9GF48_9LAMI|nr:hypothetical protein CDL12_23554 [Handroanthus impetiginosus]